MPDTRDFRPVLEDTAAGIKQLEVTDAKLAKAKANVAELTAERNAILRRLLRIKTASDELRSLTNPNKNAATGKVAAQKENRNGVGTPAVER